MVNLESVLLQLFFVLLAIGITYLLISSARALDSPYNKILVWMFVLGLGLVLLFLALRPIWPFAILLFRLGSYVNGIGIVILIWRKHKEGWSGTNEEEPE